MFKAFKPIFLTLAIIAALSLISAGDSFSQQNQALTNFNTSFSLYTNNYYAPKEDVSITIDAYSIPKKAEFEFKIYKIRDVESFFSRQTSTYTIDILSKDSTNLLYLCDEVDNFTKMLKTEGSSDYYYSYETITYKPKQKGAFIIQAKFGNKVAYAGFFVSDMGMITEAGANAMLAYTIDRKSGEPVNDVNLNFYLGSRKIGTGKTTGGLFYKDLNDEDRNYAAVNNVSYPMIIAKNGDDVAVSDPYLYFGYGSNLYQVYIFTNQPVYRPKAKVDFKGTIRKSNVGEYENYPSKEVTVTIKDSKYAECYKQVLNTNSNGSFDGTYDIPDNAPVGVYYIYAMLGENQTYTGTFSVEEYKKPEYKVDITLDKDQYTNGDDIKGVIQADYYFGSAVQEATVEYNVYKKTFYKPWWYISEYKWWYEDYYAQEDDNAKYNNADYIYSGTGQLDKEGRFDFTYNVKEDFKAKYNYWWYDEQTSYQSDFIYIIQAKVTDKSRRQISQTKTVYVTRAQFYLTSNTDKYLYKPGENVIVQVHSNDFSDKAVATTFEGTVNRVTWGRYPDYKQEKNFVTTFTGSTREDGFGSASFEAKDEGYYEIELSSIDSRGKKVTTNTYAYVSNGDFWWWYNQSGTVQIIPDKDTYKPGDICKAMIITTTPGASVLVTTQNDNILTYKTMKIEGTSQMIEIPVDGKGSPNFFINVSYVNQGSFYTGSKSVMVIPEEKFLNVEVITDKPTYKPKEEGTMTVKVTDNKGNPVSNAELSLGVVDESIYAIKQDATKDVRKFFYSPKWNTVGVHYSNAYSYYGYSRLMTIYERFNVKNTSESELGTIKGKLSDKTENAIAYATIVIDGDFVACTTDDMGNFEFKLPEGSYTVSVYTGKSSKDSEKELDVKKGRTITVNLRTDSEGLYLSDYKNGEDRGGLETQNADHLQMDESSVTTGRMKTDAKEESVPMETSKKMSKGDKDGTKTPDGENFVEADLRSDFRDAIMWSPYVETDASGMAVVKVDFPDNLTTWRITSRVITSDTKVGEVTHTVITRKDLLVRMETPRFFQQKDEVTISTIVHNYLSEDKTTKLSLKAENLEILNEEKEQTFTMGKNEEKRIDWRVRVNDPNGFAKLTATALTNQESDAVEIKVPLQPHGLKLDNYLAMDISDVNRTDINEVKIPDYTDLRSTKLTLNVAPSLASTMLTALDELVGYPYGCVEQTMSRFLPTVVVADAFHELNAPISDATKKDLPKMVESGFQRLYSMQHYDGGWGWWTNDQTHPFMTSYVIYGLAMAQNAGFEVRKDVLNNGIKSLKSQLSNKDIDATTRAYMIYSLSFVDTKDTKLFEDQFKILSDAVLNDYANGLVSMTATNLGMKEISSKYNELLLKHATVGEGAAYWGGEAWHYSWQEDKVQTTAMAVKALVNGGLKPSENPDILNKAIRWLMIQRHGGGWYNTQQTAFIVYAMVDYLKTSKELEPDYNVRIWVNNEMIMEKKMTKADIFAKEDSYVIDGTKLKTGINDVKIEKNGEGKVYVATQLSYYTNEEVIQPRENGFRVEKEYFKLEKYEHYAGDKITYRKRYFDGKVKSGDDIFVKVRISAKDKDMSYFMLEDPIPAGCEIVKDDWAYTIDEEKDYTGWDYYWWRWWYADKDIRDNRVTFFATYLWGDTYEFSYILHAQIPGTYNVIPATGSLMYYPEVRGSSEEMKLEIDD